MSTLTNLADLERRYERNERAADFVKLAGIMMTTCGAEPGKALARAKLIKASERVQQLLTAKAAVSGSTTTGLGSFGQPLANGFLDTLRAISAFDRIANDGLRVPLHPGRVIVNSSTIVATAGVEGAAKTLKNLTFVTSDVVPQKVLCQIILSRELIDALDDDGLRALGRELRVAVATGTDTAAMAVLAATNSGEVSGTPGDFNSMLGDLEELAHNVQIAASSRLYYITTPQIARGLSRAATANGVTSVGLLGGEILGVPILVSDGQAAGKITLVDASQIAVADAPITLRSSENASIEMSDTPSHDSTTPTATTLVSMFQTNSRALLAERHFAVKVLRASAAATLTGVEWATGGGSPGGF